MISRAKHGQDNPFCPIARTTLQNKALSWAARGVLGYLLSKPDNWEVSTPDLVRNGDLRRDGIRAVLKELSAAGYLRRECVQDPETGLFVWVSRIYETPIEPATAEPATAKPATAEPATAEPATAKASIKEHRRKKTQIQIKQNTHNTEAPAGAGGVVSIHSLAICQQYAQHLHDSGQGISNPGGFARAIYNGTLAGQYDAAITAWLAAPAQPKYKKLHDDPTCPRCQGYGWEYVGGDIGMRRCAAGAGGGGAAR